VRMVFKVGLIVVIAYFITSSFTVSTLANDDIPVTPNRYTLKSECLRELNYQINSELHASLVYMNMGAHFDNTKIARKGFAKFFSEQSNEEKAHAQKLVDYINTRGGRVDTINVKNPTRNEWLSVTEALEQALKLENDILDYFHKIHAIAENTCQDPHLMDFLETVYFAEQVDSISQLSRLMTVLSQMDNGVGEYLLDRQLLNGKISKDEL